MDYNSGWQIFSVKGQVIHILGFVTHKLSVTATKLCPCNMKEATNNT